MAACELLRQPINIVGAGLAGALLGCIAVRRGFKVALLCDRRPDPRRTDAEGGRSINLALAARGIAALERAGVMDRVRPLLIPMRGRMVHDASGPAALQPYGQREHEVIYSVGRAALNRVLIEEAARHNRSGDAVRANLHGRDPGAQHPAVPQSKYPARNTRYELAPTIATDGAGSAVRTSLARAAASQRARRLARSRLQGADHSRQSGPARVGSATSLHIWPRGGFMLIALPNTDGSFTATLFLARAGQNSFGRCLSSATAVHEFFHARVPDAVPLMPNLIARVRGAPAGQLGTVHRRPGTSAAACCCSVMPPTPSSLSTGRA